MTEHFSGGPQVSLTAAGWEWRCSICKERRGGYKSEREARNGLAQHDYLVGH